MTFAAGRAGREFVSHCFCCGLVLRVVARVVRVVIAQVIENIAGRNSKKCGWVCLYTTYIPGRRLLARRAPVSDAKSAGRSVVHP